MNKVTKCPVCSSDNSTLRFVATDLEYSVPGEFPVRTCASCGSGFTALIPTPDEIDSAYPSGYSAWNPGDSRLSEKIGERVIGILIGHDGIVCQQVPIPHWPHDYIGYALDLGSGAGRVTAKLREDGWRSIGIDSSESALKVSRALGNELIRANASLMPIKPQTMILVVASHVVEHLYDPINILKELRTILSPGGGITVLVPNFDGLDMRTFGKWLYGGLSVPRHFTHFSKRGLSTALTLAGFSEVTVSTLPYANFAGSLMLRIGVSRKRIESSRLLNFLRILGFPVDILFCLLGRGATLIAVGKVPTFE